MKIINQCPHTKLVQLENGVRIGFFFNEWGNEFLGSMLFQGIPHYWTIERPTSKEAGFRMLKEANETLANKVFDEIMTWDSLNAYSKEDVIDWWNN